MVGSECGVSYLRWGDRAGRTRYEYRWPAPVGIDRDSGVG